MGTIYVYLCVPTQLLLPPRRTCPRASQPAITIHIAAQNFRAPAVLRLDVDVFELQSCARHLLGTIYPRCDIISTRARDVFPRHIADLQSTAVAIAVRVDARRDVDGLVDVDEVYVAECDVTHVTLSRICLDPGGVGGVDCFDVLKDDVFDVFWDVGGITHGANAHGTGFVAGHVFDVDVGAVAFDGYAVLKLSE